MSIARPHLIFHSRYATRYGYSNIHLLHRLLSRYVLSPSLPQTCFLRGWHFRSLTRSLRGDVPIQPYLVRPAITSTWVAPCPRFNMIPNPGGDPPGIQDTNGQLNAPVCHPRLDLTGHCLLHRIFTSYIKRLFGIGEAARNLTDRSCRLLALQHSATSSGFMNNHYF